MSAEGQLIFYIYMGMLSMIGIFLGRKIMDKSYEYKGFIGMLIVCYSMAFLLWYFAGDISSTINVSRSDIYFFALITAILPTIFFLIRGREKIKKAGGISTKAVRGTKKAAKNVSRK